MPQNLHNQINLSNGLPPLPCALPWVCEPCSLLKPCDPFSSPHNWENNKGLSFLKASSWEDNGHLFLNQRRKEFFTEQKQEEHQIVSLNETLSMWIWDDHTVSLTEHAHEKIRSLPHSFVLTDTLHTENIEQISNNTPLREEALLVAKRLQHTTVASMAQWANFALGCDNPKSNTTLWPWFLEQNKRKTLSGNLLEDMMNLTEFERSYTQIVINALFCAAFCAAVPLTKNIALATRQRALKTDGGTTGLTFFWNGEALRCLNKNKGTLLKILWKQKVQTQNTHKISWIKPLR